MSIMDVMNSIERCVSWLAPHTCLVCKIEGSPLCALCGSSFAASNQVLDLTLSAAYTRAWAVTDYSGLAKELVYSLKFNRGKQSASVIASLMDATLPSFPPATIVSHIPTAQTRIRMRGYDQAALIAILFAKKRQLKHLKCLQRVTKTRQVGASRQQRSNQMKAAFRVHKPKRLHDRPILLIDDITTTGATLNAAALLVKKYTDQPIYGLVFAYQPR